jgi:hypothetical protein
MKKRIEELKKMDDSCLKNIASHLVAGFCYPSSVPIEVVSARMWEKARKEANETTFATTILTFFQLEHKGVLEDAVVYFFYDATSTDKLICAIAALEAIRRKGEAK